MAYCTVLYYSSVDLIIAVSVLWSCQFFLQNSLLAIISIGILTIRTLNLGQ